MVTKGEVYFELIKNPRYAIKEEALCLIWAKEIKMKKLMAVLVLVMLLTLPVVGLAEGQGNPRKPGTQTNPGLWWAATWGYYMSNGANWLGLVLSDWLFGHAPPFPFVPGGK